MSPWKPKRMRTSGEGFSERLDADAVGRVDVGGVLNNNGQRREQLVSVQNLVVLQAVEQGSRDAVRITGREDGRPWKRVGGLLSRASTSSSIGVSRRRVFAARIFAPLRQVKTTSITRAPISSGTHPPWKTLRRFAERNVVSMSRNGTISAAVAHRVHSSSSR